MATYYHDWPFRPHAERYEQEQAQWWETCYLAGAADHELADLTGWTLITGAPGAGRSSALMAWMAGQAGTSLIVDYPPERWPGGDGAWLPDDNRHLAQMITGAGWAFYELLEAEPERAAALSDLQRQFFRALIERSGARGRRQYLQLIPLFGEEEATWRAVEVADDLREVPQTRRDLELQVKDVTWLARALGLSRVVFTFDLPADARALGESLQELYRGLDVLNSREFIVVAAAPESVLIERGLVSSARGRVHSVECRWSEQECRRIAWRHLCAALEREPDGSSLDDFAAPDLLAKAGEVIAAEYGQPTPAGWVALAETLLYMLHRPNDPPKPPITAESTTEAVNLFFARHMSLQLDPVMRGVRRGPRLLMLDDQPYRFLELLIQRRGAPVNWDDEAIQSLAGSKNNVHTLAARARKAIEPFPRQPIYLLNDRGAGGYRLVNAALAGHDGLKTGR